MKTETIYKEVPVSERLPIEEGWYSTSFLTGLQDFFWFDGSDFYNPENRKVPIKVTHWLEKKEDQVVMSREEFDQYLKGAYDEGFNDGNNNANMKD